LFREQISESVNPSACALSTKLIFVLSYSNVSSHKHWKSSLSNYFLGNHHLPGESIEAPKATSPSDEVPGPRNRRQRIAGVEQNTTPNQFNEESDVVRLAFFLRR
jgi:hypothetical protein